jgi:hypothetical protein
VGRVEKRLFKEGKKLSYKKERTKALLKGKIAIKVLI